MQSLISDQELKNLSTKVKDGAVKGKIKAGKIIIYIFLLVLTVVMLYPAVLMVMLIFFDAKEFAMTQITLFPIAKNPTLDSLLLLFTFPVTYPDFGMYLTNSVLRTGYSIFTSCFTTLICGYAFSKVKFRGSRRLLLFLIMCSMMPGTLTLIPTYLIYLNFPFGGETGILDSWWVYLIGGPGINVMGTFVVKQFMDTLPTSLEESAKIDGAGTLRIIFQIIFPLCLPILAYIAITCGLATWNDWGGSFFFTKSNNLQTISSILSKAMLDAQDGLNLPNYPAMISLGLILTIPSLLIYIFFQKYIVEGIANTGIKG